MSSDEDEIDAGGTLEVMDPTGHFEVRWGRKKSEVEAAEATFNDLLKKGYAAFKKTFIGRKGKPATEFDPKEGSYIFDAAPKEDVAAKDNPPATKVHKGEIIHEQTKSFDKKADTTLVPPLRGG